MANQPTWVASLGSNSGKITYPAAALLADLIDTVDAWITAHGWELFDASAGTNARAYRALNKDGSTYKYIVLDYNAAGYIQVRTYESWNATTHAGTNLAYYSDNTTYAQRADLTNGAVLYIFATSRYLVMQSYLTTGGAIGSPTGASWCGCIEVARDNPEDTPAAGYPCWIWANGAIYTYGSNSSMTWNCPRARDGGVGTGGQGHISNGYHFVGGAYQGFGWGDSMGGTNAWNSKNYAFTLRWLRWNVEIRGRIFGIKVTGKNQGGLMDEMSIKTDADSFFSPNGTLTGHWVLTESVVGGRYVIPK